MKQILTARAKDSTLDTDTLNGMFRFRYKVFYEHLQWDVANANGMERDAFDDLNPVYILARNHNKEVEGFWRLLPTTGPYMLRDTFPQLLCGSNAPHDPAIWELSRFAVMPSTSDECTQVVMNTLAFDMIRSAFDFAKQHGIERYVTVTSVSLERLLKRTGLPVHRLEGQTPQRIGKVLTVACYVDINDDTREVVYRNFDAAHAAPIAA